MGRDRGRCSSVAAGKIVLPHHHGRVRHRGAVARVCGRVAMRRRLTRTNTHMAGSLRLAGGGAHVVGGRAWHRMASTSNLHDIGSFGLELECGERSSTECEKRRTMWSHSHVLTLSAFSVRTSHCVSFRTATRAAAIPVPLPRIPRHGQMKQNILIRRPDGLWRVNARARAARGLCQPEATPPRARYAVAMPDAVGFRK